MAPYFVYVTLSGEDKIAVYAMDRDSGKLDLVDSVVSVPGLPAPLALHPSRRFLFAARRSDLEVSSFEVDSASGRLSHIGAVPLESDPCYLATDRRGDYLFSAYYAGGGIGVHRIRGRRLPRRRPGGVALNRPGSALDPGGPLEPVRLRPSHRDPVGREDDGLNAILQFTLDQDTGRLTPGTPPQVAPSGKLGPRHFCFHPTLDLLYFSDEQGNSVTSYSLDPALGTLRPVQTVSTLPEGTTVSNTCAQIQISPTGRMLYAPNRGHDTIACFSVDAKGRLERVANVPTEPTPRAFSLDPAGKFLLAAGLDSGKLAAYRTDEAAGNLEPVATYDVGSGPMWVLIADLS